MNPMVNKLSSKISEKRFHQLIEELADKNCHCDYCFLKKFIESLNPEPIVIMQLKCIEMYKWEESEREGHDIGWNEAGIRWATNGYATAYRKVFDHELPIREIYRLTCEEVLKNHS